MAGPELGIMENGGGESIGYMAEMDCWGIGIMERFGRAPFPFKARRIVESMMKIETVAIPIMRLR